jgi:hypothetical protein
VIFRGIALLRILIDHQHHNPSIPSQENSVMKLHCLALALLLQSAGALADVKPLPQSQWPRTVAEAVPHILTSMSPTQRSIVSETSKDSLFLLGEWGEDVEKLLGLDSGNRALVEDACGRACSAKQATLMLVEATWKALKY